MKIRPGQLCAELRDFLVREVSRTGGHLASNLGVVELTVAIHRVFDTSVDRLVFDVGHQCYVHKALTGRRELFDTLRQFGGLSGFPKPWESVHDAFIAGHASNSVSVALGMARARTLQGKDYHVLALIGDGAMGGGLSFEGLNDAGASGEPLIVILNDNGMSIDPNVGGLSRHLSRLRSTPEYYEFKRRYRQMLTGSQTGKRVYAMSHDVKTALKKSLLPGSTVFENMGFTYMGPVDGPRCGDPDPDAAAGPGYAPAGAAARAHRQGKGIPLRPAGAGEIPRRGPLRCGDRKAPEIVGGELFHRVRP